jgi:hypothetical protein
MTAGALATGADTGFYRPAEATSDDDARLGRSFWESLYGLLVARSEPRTGQDTMPAPRSTAVRNAFPLIDVRTKPTGYGWMSAPVLRAYVVEGDPQDLDETASREPVVSFLMEPGPEVTLWGVEPLSVEAREQPPEATAVERLAALTGLEMERLAELLGVSRTTLYAWRDGSKLRGRKRDHLLQVGAVMEEVAERLGPPREVAAWLLTPSPASNRRPFDVLRDARYDLCRSMLTRRRTARVVLPQRAPRRFSGTELRHRVERISPKPSVEDYEPGEERDD